MKLTFSSIVLATTLFASQWVNASAPLAFHNQYESSALGFKITVTHALTPLGDGRYDMLFRAESWFASINETSKLSWDDKNNRVIPLEYNYKRRGVGKNRDHSLVFNWQDLLVNDLVNKQNYVLPSEQTVQDKLSYQLQLQQDLADGKTQFNYLIQDGNKLRDYAFETVGNETLTTPLGKIDTIKVKRSRENSDRVTYAWLAPQYDFLLIRMQQEEKGDVYNITITKANIDGKAIDAFK